MTAETDRMLLIQHTADRALKTKEEVTILQDVSHDQYLLIKSLTAAVEELQAEVARLAQNLPE